ncbi:MAG: hypothetical protein CHACPFDD_02641 [Phycisphaerae bacterium]|nr:hypothetical protein [Phycisphaerae bacterium]
MSVRILFVDDEPRVLDGLRRMLREQRHAWELTFVESGAAALAELERAPFDMVVSDLRMPGMDGAALLSAVRERHPRIARVMLSGDCDRGMILRSVGPAHQFLAKPCEPDVLRQTVQRAVGLRALLHSDALEQVIASLEALPCLPEPYLRIQDELRAAEPSINHIGAIIVQDLAMTTKVLHVVNSAFFGLRRHVASPVDAAKLLGTETISSLVLSLQLFQHFSGLCEANIEAIAAHSLRVATLARAICKTEQADRLLADHAFLAGLLHDAGKLVLAQSHPQLYASVSAREASESAASAEQRVFGVTHAEVAAYLYGLWGFSDSIVEAVALHHQPERLPDPAFGPLTAVYVADALDRRGDRPAEAALDQAHLERIGKVQRVAAWAALADQQAQQEARA